MINHKDSERLVKGLASRVMRRLTAAGAPTHIKDDVRQELWCAWCIARDRFDEAGGASFHTYCYMGMLRHINRWAENNVSKRHAEVIAKSLEAPIGEDMDGGSLGDLLPDVEAAAPDAMIVEESHWDLAMSFLTPRARQFITLLRDQPPELLEETRKIEARTAYARENGIAVFQPAGITTTMIADLMGLSKSERMQIAADIKKAGAMVQEMTTV